MQGLLVSQLFCRDFSPCPTFPWFPLLDPIQDEETTRRVFPCGSREYIHTSLLTGCLETFSISFSQLQSSNPSLRTPVSYKSREFMLDLPNRKKPYRIRVLEVDFLLAFPVDTVLQIQEEK
jgi:hypothetical protein